MNRAMAFNNNNYDSAIRSISVDTTANDEQANQFYDGNQQALEMDSVGDSKYDYATAFVKSRSRPQEQNDNSTVYVNSSIVSSPDDSEMVCMLYTYCVLSLYAFIHTE